MKKTVSKLSIGDGLTRVRVVLTSDECSDSGLASRSLKYGLLRAVVDQPDLLNGSDFQKLRLFHDGQRWTMETESVVDSPQ